MSGARGRVVSRRLSERAKRAVSCPECGAAPGAPCKSSRIPSPASFGGGWGGPPDLDRAHSARRAAALDFDGVEELSRRLGRLLLGHDFGRGRS